jgi:D-glycero-D-manno-heptose 1,7-bisphosphate phosphatase
MAVRRRAIFLDKDGTLVEDVPYAADTSNVRILPGVVGGLRLLNSAGYLFIVISNQSGIARGLFAEADLLPVKQRLEDELAAFGLPLAAFCYCPHNPNGSVREYSIECDCRKPKPGLLLRAASQHNIDLSGSWMIGDKESDIAAGQAAGCRTVLLASNPPPRNDRPAPDVVAPNLKHAAQAILSRDC